MESLLKKLMNDDSSHMVSLEDLFVHELKDIYDAENQILEALPKMIEKANSQELKEGFRMHMEQTENHVKRLEQLAKAMEIDLKGVSCKGMEGIIKEGEEALKLDAEEEVKDAAIIAAAQKVEHYEITTYANLIEQARAMENEGAIKLLQATLAEEKATDEKLTKLDVSQILPNAVAMVE